ncbi:MAG: alcohol dehydrogenase catalytic domain-containing protein [Acidimicrobiia bacterium]|nr:alcohol dehydrogenase catalytic domain-containing protein [Acidimicrobiia bacterium]
MRAVTFVEPFRVVVDDVPEPNMEAATDVIVQVESSAICGSDLHPYRGHEVGLDSGTVLGHEFVGLVAEVGDAVTRFREGDRVVSPFSTSCGDCWYCGASLTARCARGQLFGWIENGEGLQGGQAEFVRAPLADSTLLAVPAKIGQSAAALFAGDILATALFAVAGGNVSPGDTIAVVGAGPVGQMAVVAAQESPADVIWAIDPLLGRRTLAESFGAMTATPEDAPRLLAEATEGRGADVVIEAVGSSEATALAYAIVRPGGTISAAGVHTEPHFAFSPGAAYDKNLTYTAGRCSARVFAPQALEIVASGRYDLEAIISHTLPLDEAATGYTMFDARTDDCTKVLLVP